MTSPSETSSYNFENRASRVLRLRFYVLYKRSVLRNCDILQDNVLYVFAHNVSGISEQLNVLLDNVMQFY